MKKKKKKIAQGPFGPDMLLVTTASTAPPTCQNPSSIHLCLLPHRRAHTPPARMHLREPPALRAGSITCVSSMH